MNDYYYYYYFGELQGCVPDTGMLSFSRSAAAQLLQKRPKFTGGPLSRRPAQRKHRSKHQRHLHFHR